MNGLLINILLLLLQKFLIRIIQMIKRNWIQACSAKMHLFPKESLSNDSLKVQPTGIILSARCITRRQRSCGKVMFKSCLSIIHSVHRAVPCDHYPWCIGPHCTDPCPFCTGTHLCTGFTPRSDIWWPRQDTCSNLFTWGSPMVLTSGGGYCRSIYSQCKQAVCILLECFLVLLCVSSLHGMVIGYGRIHREWRAKYRTQQNIYFSRI